MTMPTRNDNVVIVQLVDPVTGDPSAPAYLDMRLIVNDTAPDDKFVTADSSLRLDVMGLEYLMDAAAYWAILDLNGVLDPFVEIVPGMSLRVPSLQRYQQMLQTTGSLT